MPRDWFRHDRDMRRDPAIRTLAREFGPAGYTAWSCLLELHCDNDNAILVLREDLPTELAMLPEWDFDVDAWLARATDLGLIKVSYPQRSAPNLLKIVAKRFGKKNPGYETRAASAERKARSRAKNVTGTDPPSHSDNFEASHGTRRNELDVQTEQDVTNSRAREKSTSNGGVSHEAQAKAERVHAERHRLIPQPELCRLCRDVDVAADKIGNVKAIRA